ncbi:MAG: hypothetical protein IPM97_01430 [Bdellovibrionaceae bacterium]|nr:hypothetical protein [Pseudobdellovibrionaceae bacterium]
MKSTLLTLLCLFSISANATSLHPDTFKAIECREAASGIAKLNIDQKARAYTFQEGQILEKAKFKESEQVGDEKLYIYNVEAFISKATYNVEVKVDSSCSVNSVKITEILPLP